MNHYNFIKKDENYQASYTMRAMLPELSYNLMEDYYDVMS